MDSFDDEFDDLDVDELLAASQPSPRVAKATLQTASKLLKNAFLLSAIIGLTIGVATSLLGGDSRAYHAAGYVLGSLLPITALALYRRQAERVAADKGIRLASSVSYTTTALMALGLLIGAAQAVGIANTVVSG